MRVRLGSPIASLLLYTFLPCCAKEPVAVKVTVDAREEDVGFLVTGYVNKKLASYNGIVSRENDPDFRIHFQAVRTSESGIIAVGVTLIMVISENCEIACSPNNAKLPRIKDEGFYLSSAVVVTREQKNLKGVLDETIEKFYRDWFSSAIRTRASIEAAPTDAPRASKNQNLR